jgi:hypothetical protein
MPLSSRQGHIITAFMLFISFDKTDFSRTNHEAYNINFLQIHATYLSK